MIELQHAGVAYKPFLGIRVITAYKRCEDCEGTCAHCPYDPMPQGSDEGIERSFMVRTQWFCCETEPPVHNGVYEIRFKQGWRHEIINRISYDANRGNHAWDGYPGYMGHLEWRGLAVKP